MVTSPGGTTISAIRELENAGVRAAFLNAINAACDRARGAGDRPRGVSRARKRVAPVARAGVAFLHAALPVHHQGRAIRRRPAGAARRRESVPRRRVGGDQRAPAHADDLSRGVLDPPPVAQASPRLGARRRLARRRGRGEGLLEPRRRARQAPAGAPRRRVRHHRRPRRTGTPASAARCSRRSRSGRAEVGVERIQLRVFDNERACARLYERLGYADEGVERLADEVPRRVHRRRPDGEARSDALRRRALRRIAARSELKDRSCASRRARGAAATMSRSGEITEGDMAEEYPGHPGRRRVDDGPLGRAVRGSQPRRPRRPHRDLRRAATPSTSTRPSGPRRPRIPDWLETPAPKRAEYVYRVGLLLEQRKEELAPLMSREMGKTLAREPRRHPGGHRLRRLHGRGGAADVRRHHASPSCPTSSR